MHGNLTPINNPSSALSACVEELSLDQAMAQFDVNYRGALAFTRKFLSHLKMRMGKSNYICVIFIEPGYIIFTALCLSHILQILPHQLLERVALSSDGRDLIVKETHGLIDNCNKWAVFFKLIDYKT
ncbi:hypothetical protein E3P77_01856 [Wallemia ichthyophaga]|nr:hypothetical protein E3P97_02251 [Wallemia ichthyophaga]TIB06172.1 hypothetical protein E3P96_00691 [Wallemia ichthyophaga]TIB32573.1 hypothetical protein E3P85_01800 [Wallemia ichthyophaga]TIB46431.1 hypothetical protein E3P82_02249 [Wallemia ichthyophaga]TIB50409.1 hypothetical protein E3P81_02252 [Wallemia ichthyophaga]